MENKINILNVGFNPVGYDEIIAFLLKNRNRKGYICFPDIYNILRANDEDWLWNIYNQSILTLPDGKPSEIILKIRGYKQASTISGYWLCTRLLNTGLSHYFYGTNEINLKLMKQNLVNKFPTANILGFKSPPFLDESDIKHSNILRDDIKEIYSLKPGIIWIGISSPKQDLLMSHFSNNNTGTVMIGVGAVFDYFARTAPMGPEWIKKLSLRWLYQLINDPKRYYPRLKYIFRKLPKALIKEIKRR